MEINVNGAELFYKKRGAGFPFKSKTGSGGKPKNNK